MGKGFEWIFLQRRYTRGAWVVQLVELPTSAQVIISWSVGSSRASDSVLTTQSGSVLTAQSLGPTSDSVSPSLSVPLLLVLCLSLSLPQNK